MIPEGTQDILLQYISTIDELLGKLFIKLEDNDDICDKEWKQIDDHFTRIYTVLGNLKNEIY